jgi:hypothetical protein
MISKLMTARRAIEVPCTVDLEQTSESLHAYVELHGVHVNAGDQVIVHDAPTAVNFGDRIVCDRRATVVRATPLGSLLARLAGYAELTELYEVSFSHGRIR